MWTQQLIREVKQKFGEFADAKTVDKFDINVLDLGNIAPTVFTVLHSTTHQRAWTFEYVPMESVNGKPTAKVRCWTMLDGQCIDGIPEMVISKIMTKEDLKLYAVSESVVSFLTKLTLMTECDDEVEVEDLRNEMDEYLGEE